MEGTLSVGDGYGEGTECFRGRPTREDPGVAPPAKRGTCRLWRRARLSAVLTYCGNAP